jgi:hypothetical protein
LVLEDSFHKKPSLKDTNGVNSDYEKNTDGRLKLMRLEIKKISFVTHSVYSSKGKTSIFRNHCS